jgi:O-antigen/teichoic acid export membrane protein
VHAELDAARTLWHAAMRKVAALLFPVFVFAFVMAEPLIRLLFSKTYADAAIPFRIFLCLLPLRLCGYGAVARAFGRSRPVLWGSLAAMATNLALAWPLWLALGLAGPALATILGQMVGIAVLLTSIRGSLRCRWSALLPCGPLARTLLVAGVSGVVLLVPHGLDLPDAAALAVGGPLYLLAYLCLGRLGGVITPADLRALATIFHLPVPRWIRPSTGS